MPTASSSAALRAVALGHFAASGFEGASLQRIASDAGLSKSSVLYHFDSKEALFDAALRPAVDALRELVTAPGDLADAAAQQAFLDRFVQFLFEHRLAVATIVNHGQVLAGTPVVDEADALIRSFATSLDPVAEGDRIRFSVALSGAVFVLVAADRWSDQPLPEGDAKRLLVPVLAEFLLPAAEPQPV